MNVGNGGETGVGQVATPSWVFDWLQSDNLGIGPGELRARGFCCKILGQRIEGFEFTGKSFGGGDATQVVRKRQVNAFINVVVGREPISELACGSVFKAKLANELVGFFERALRELDQFFSARAVAR